MRKYSGTRVPAPPYEACCFFGRETPQVRVLLPAPFPSYTSGRRAFTAEHFKRTFTPPGRTGSRRLRAPLPSGEALSVFAERVSPGLRAGCPSDERWRHNPSHLLIATPVVLGPARSNPEGG